MADVNKAGLTFDDLRNLNGSQILMTAVPGLYYRLLKEDQTTRVLANPQLRTLVGMAAQARFGERVPVPITTFSPIATGGIAQQPITSYDYQNIGVNIDITPRTHFDNAVTLALTISVTSISGEGFGGIPTFGNREVKTQIRLRDGETNMLAGLIRDDERRTRNGIPGLSDIPGIGHLFGHSTNERTQTDIILMLTPRIVRVLDLTEADLRAFQMGRGAPPSGIAGAPAGGVELPLPGQPAPAPPSADDPLPQPGGVIEPAKPIMPPVHHLSRPAGTCPRAPYPARLVSPALPPIVARAAAQGTRPAIVDGHTTYSYADLDRTSAQISSQLLSGRDNLDEARVAFLVAPSFEHVAIQWGIWRAGGIAVPLPMSHPAAELDYLIRDAEASIVIADAANADVVAPIAQAVGAQFLTTDELSAAGLKPCATSTASQDDIPSVDISSVDISSVVRALPSSADITGSAGL